MNEIYKLLQNVQAIAAANNQFLQSFEQRLDRLEQRIALIEAAVVITPEAEPNAAGADTEVEK